MVSDMTERIGMDLFATVMRMPSEDRKDILEYLGQSHVLPDLGGCIPAVQSRGDEPAPGVDQPVTEQSATAVQDPQQRRP